MYQSSSLWRSSRDLKPNVVVSLVPLLEPIHQRPQSEMLRALCNSLFPFFLGGLDTSQERVSEIFSELLTRKGVSG
jgi:hypothetical protein